MNSSINPHTDSLSLISHYLASNIDTVEAELNRSKEQLGCLVYAKALVDESLKTLMVSSSFQNAADLTLIPTSSLLVPISQQLSSIPPGSGRSLICDQIRTIVHSGVAAFIAASPNEIQPSLSSLKVVLSTGDQELLSLEDRLGIRLSKYSDHLPQILKGALQSFRDANNATRYTNTANLLRELLREFLEVVAPDSQVKRAPWFKPDKTSKSGVTRRHRIDYAIFGGLTADKFPAVFIEQTNEITEGLLADISTLSAFTHVTELVLGKNYSEAAPVFATTMQRFLQLISAIETTRVLVERDIASDIRSRLDSVFLEGFFDELDCLSSHTRPQRASDIEISNLKFDETWIGFEGTGVIECDLQWGSDGDVERDDGAESSDSYPFVFAGRVQIGDLSEIEVKVTSIDTGKFYQ